MNNFLLKAANHEAGHALMAYIVGFSIDSITLWYEGVEVAGITKYDFNGLQKVTQANQLRRLYCVLGGPAGEALLTGTTRLNLNGPDFETVNGLLLGMNVGEREILLSNSGRSVLGLLSLPGAASARALIVKELTSRLYLSHDMFEEIVADSKVQPFPPSSWTEHTLDSMPGIVPGPLERLKIYILKFFAEIKRKG